MANSRWPMGTRDLVWERLRVKTGRIAKSANHPGNTMIHSRMDTDPFARIRLSASAHDGMHASGNAGRAINDYGIITSSFEDSSGIYHGFVLTP
jgi:hypothetical protein